MIYLGDFPASHTAVCIPWDSFAASTGASSAASAFAASDVLVYKDGGTTQRSSSAGITVSTSFDSQTGLQMIVIDLSDNTDAGFYAAGHEYQVGVADVTIDAQTVRFWAATFSIERAGGVLALLKGNAVKVDVNTIKTQPITAASAITVLASVGTAATSTAQTGDNFARIGAAGAGLTALGDTRIANLDATVSSRSTFAGGAVSSVTGNVGGNVVGSVGSVTGGVTVTTNNDKAGYALTAGERTAIANEVEAQIIDETDSEKVLQAITDKIASVNPDLGGLSVAAIASAAATAVWGAVTRTLTSGANIALAKGTGVTGFNDLDAAGVRAAIGLVAANLDAQIATLSTYAGGDTAGTTTLLARLTAIRAALLDNLDAMISSRLPTSSYTAPDNAGIAAAEAAAASAATAASSISTAVAALPTAAQIADKYLGRNIAGGSDGGRMVKDSLRALRNKTSIAGGVLTVMAEDDTTPAWTAAVTTAPGDPLTSIDPA